MKSLILALLIATTTLTQAQQLTPPKTIVFTNNKTGEKIGTATISDGKAYLRDKDGIHYATIVQNADGTRTLYDPSGKVIEASSLNLPNLPE